MGTRQTQTKLGKTRPVAAVIITELVQIIECLASESAIDAEDSFKLKRICYNYTNFGQSFN
jgi:hypothetical protein